MPVLDALISAIRDARVEVVDLTSRLDSATPVIRLPEPFGNTQSFALHEISRYDERGPAWYWNDISTGEHTGTHFDAPVHWATGRDGEDVAQVPVTSLIAPAVVLDFSEQAAADPDFLLEIEHIVKWESEHGPLPAGGWLLYRTAHARDLGGVRAVAGERVAGDRARGRDRRHGRRRGALVRPPVPVSFLAARRRQVRPDPAAEPGPAAGDRRGRDRGAAADHRRVRQ